MPIFRVNETREQEAPMTAYTKLKTALSQHANYRRTRRAIAALPPELAIEDLGLNPYDAKSIARRAVYG
ncbi:hypothetical protein RB2654_02404 [Maritimibacter alkaliphilus HTCC2654]|jgi:uncharacterized protein YjiS (DUF1127 family)|uniref:DUF1127 domain-containing protein n=2 Tax=Roseobacteraceae TaxID=2854170 RepID=A3VDD9_9RHOB|nr:hypothetical protein RB2654_02404 [Maritimibacter alkaliphilus HTCC2654]